MMARLETRRAQSSVRLERKALNGYGGIISVKSTLSGNSQMTENEKSCRRQDIFRKCDCRLGVDDDVIAMSEVAMET